MNLTNKQIKCNKTLERAVFSIGLQSFLFHNTKFALKHS